MSSPSNSLRRHLLSGAAAAALLVLSLAATGAQTACSSKTCSTSEEQACTNTYTMCTNAAAAAGDKAACQKCVDDYCACYDKCGNKCEKDKLAAACT